MSGSTREAWPRLYGLVRSLGPLVSEPVFLFSTRVVPTSLEHLLKGQVWTDHGTDFDAVARHLLAQRFRRALVLTDGIGPLDPALARALEAARVGLYVLLTDEPGRWDGGITRVAREVWRLPERRVEIPDYVPLAKPASLTGRRAGSRARARSRPGRR